MKKHTLKTPANLQAPIVEVYTFTEVLEYGIKHAAIFQNKSKNPQYFEMQEMSFSYEPNQKFWVSDFTLESGQIMTKDRVLIKDNCGVYTMTESEFKQKYKLINENF